MRIYASGEAQYLIAPGEFLSSNPFGRVVGLIDLGDNNGCNDFGWTGLKAVIDVDGEEFVLDFPSSRASKRMTGSRLPVAMRAPF